MPLIESATTYILDTILQNEEFRRFPQDFIGASVRWVRSWFLEDDPRTEAKLTAPDKSVDYKKGVVESKLEHLLENPQFKQELESKLEEYERHAATIQTDNSQRQSLDSNTLTAGGNINFNPQQFAAQGNINVTNYHYASPPAPPEAPPLATINKPVVSKGVKQNLQALVANNRVKEVITQLHGLSAGDAEFQKLVIHQSSNWENLKHDEMMGIISHSDAGLVRNKIVMAVLGLIEELREVG